MRDAPGLAASPQVRDNLIVAEGLPPLVRRWRTRLPNERSCPLQHSSLAHRRAPPDPRSCRTAS